MSFFTVINFKTGAVVYDTRQDHDGLTLAIGDFLVKHRPTFTHINPPPPEIVYMTKEEAAEDDRLRDLADKYDYKPSYSGGRL